MTVILQCFSVMYYNNCPTASEYYSSSIAVIYSDCFECSAGCFRWKCV